MPKFNLISSKINEIKKSNDSEESICSISNEEITNRSKKNEKILENLTEIKEQSNTKEGAFNSLEKEISWEKTNEEIVYDLSPSIYDNVRESILKSQSPTKKTHLKENTRKTKKKTSWDLEDQPQDLLDSPMKEVEKKIANKADFHFYKYITNFYLVNKFIKKLRNSTPFRTPKWLKLFHYGLINDWTYFEWNAFDEQSVVENLKRKLKRTTSFLNKRIKFMQSFKECCEKVSKNFKNIPVWEPTSKIRIIWDICHLFIMTLLFLIIPINIFFNVDLPNGYLKNENFEHNFASWILRLPYFFLAFDFAVNFNSSFYKKGQLITDRNVIAKRYIKKNFLFDFIRLFFIKINCISFFAILPLFGYFNFFDWIRNIWYIKWLSLFFFLRLGSSFSKIYTKLEEFFFIDEKFHHVLNLLKLCFRIILVSHFFACIWHYLAYFQVQNTNENTWLHAYDLVHSGFLKKYLSSYYFVCVTMNTVGYGDIGPQNSIETIFCIFFIYVACAVFAYSMNTIGIIVQDINKHAVEFKKNIFLINGFMKKKNINLDLRMKIRKYLAYTWKEEKMQNEEDLQRVVDMLSDSLKEDLLLEAYGNHIMNIPIFRENFSAPMLEKLVYFLKQYRYMPNDIIYASHEPEFEYSIFIIVKGEVELFVESPRNENDYLTSFHKVKKGGYFGELSFFSGTERDHWARSTDFTTVFVIKQADFQGIAKEFPEDWERFCEIKDKINIYKNPEDLYIQCISCKEFNHTCLECPLLHLVPSKQRIIAKYNFSQPQKGDNSFKRKRLKFSAYKLFWRLQKCQEIILKNLITSEILSMYSVNGIFTEENDDEDKDNNITITKEDDNNMINEENENSSESSSKYSSMKSSMKSSKMELSKSGTFKEDILMGIHNDKNQDKDSSFKKQAEAFKTFQTSQTIGTNKTSKTSKTNQSSKTSKTNKSNVTNKSNKTSKSKKTSKETILKLAPNSRNSRSIKIKLSLIENGSMHSSSNEVYAQLSPGLTQRSFQKNKLDVESSKNIEIRKNARKLTSNPYKFGNFNEKYKGYLQKKGSFDVDRSHSHENSLIITPSAQSLSQYNENLNLVTEHLAVQSPRLKSQNNPISSQNNTPQVLINEHNIIETFDKFFLFKRYFTHNNYNSVIIVHNKLRKENIKLKQLLNIQEGASHEEAKSKFFKMKTIKIEENKLSSNVEAFAKLRESMNEKKVKEEKKQKSFFFLIFRCFRKKKNINYVKYKRHSAKDAIKNTITQLHEKKISYLVSPSKRPRNSFQINLNPASNDKPTNFQLIN